VIAPIDLQPYGHIVALEMAAREIRLIRRQIEKTLAPTPPMVFCGNVPFENYTEAARFVVELGASPLGVNATATAIKRAAQRRQRRYGFRWRLPKQGGSNVRA
jgi:hypothetical protein